MNDDGQSGPLTPLGQFLRARRARVRPDQHGLPVSRRRRTPGLRREEVAMLTGVSTDYYVHLEQGRETNPSRELVEELVAALLLDEMAAGYLRALVSPVGPSSPTPDAPERVSPGLTTLMQSWPDDPALVHGRCMDVLAANGPGRALFSWLGAETNLMRGIFLNPEARTFYREWDVVSESCVAALRAADTAARDPRVHRLAAELLARSGEFAELWSRHEVRSKSTHVKLLHHIAVGDLELRFENLAVEGAPGQHLVVYHAEPGTSDSAALTRIRFAHEHDRSHEVDAAAARPSESTVTSG